MSLSNPTAENGALRGIYIIMQPVGKKRSSIPCGVWKPSWRKLSKNGSTGNASPILCVHKRKYSYVVETVTMYKAEWLIGHYCYDLSLWSTWPCQLHFIHLHILFSGQSFRSTGDSQMMESRRRTRSMTTGGEQCCIFICEWNKLYWLCLYGYSWNVRSLCFYILQAHVCIIEVLHSPTNNK